MKKYLIMIFIALICFSNNVYASSYEMKLETNSLEVEKDSSVDVFIKLKNISGFTNGLNACEATLSSDSSIKINSITGENNWNATSGAKLVLDSSSGALSDMSIAKLNVTISDGGTINLNNINCTDGDNEYASSNNSISFTIKQVNTNVETNTNVGTNNESNNNYISSDNVENPKTGLPEVIGVLSVISVITLMIYKVTKKKDLFKKI